jgi:hypothetical protein
VRRDLAAGSAVGTRHRRLVIPARILLVDVPARLVAAVSLPSASRLRGFSARRTPTGPLASVLAGDRMMVYDLGRLLAGGSGPVAGFPAPWADGRPWNHEYTFLPDLSAAVFSLGDRVRAVSPGGSTRWEWVHAADPQEAEDDGGAVVATPGGTQVWAVVPGTGEGGTEGQDLAVLAAADGRLLGRATVPARHEAAAFPVAHPDGRHVGMNFGAQEYCTTVWAVLDDGGTVRSWPAPWDGENVVDISPDGKLVASYDTDRQHVAQWRFPGGGLAGEADVWEMREILDGVPVEDDSDCDYEWYETGGFVDAQTVLATLIGPDDTTWSHWLLGTPPGPARYDRWTGMAPRRVTYQDAPSGAYPYLYNTRAMGDGTWLTAAGDSVQQWTLA